MPRSQEIGFDIPQARRFDPLPRIVVALGYAIAVAALAIVFLG